MTLEDLALLEKGKRNTRWCKMFSSDLKSTGPILQGKNLKNSLIILKVKQGVESSNGALYRK